MIVKFFKNPKKKYSHGISAINYLLNNRVLSGTARVLKGDEKLTRIIIGEISNVEKLTVGCLSFEEKNIPEKLKNKLMDDFEQMLIPSMRTRVNFLWVEHRDKDRLELNFVIPKIDLQTGKSINPYFHSADLPRVETWQQLQNFKYNFSNPQDPSKKRTVEVTNSEFSKLSSYEKLDELLQKLVVKNQIQNRDQLIEVCTKNNIKVARRSDNYISLLLPNCKKARRFKHGIYCSKFTSLDQLEEIKEEKKNEIENFKNIERKQEINRLKSKLVKLIANKKEKLKEKYKIKEKNVNRKANKRFKRTRRYRYGRLYFAYNSKIEYRPRRNNLYKMSRFNVGAKRRRYSMLLSRNAHTRILQRQIKKSILGPTKSRSSSNTKNYSLRPANFRTQRVGRGTKSEINGERGRGV